MLPVMDGDDDRVELGRFQRSNARAALGCHATQQKSRGPRPAPASLQRASHNDITLGILSQKPTYAIVICIEAIDTSAYRPLIHVQFHTLKNSEVGNSSV